VDSALVGIAKPAPAIFASALEALALDPEEVAYVGDSVR
jgi:FMN phosphatase YigB (HAD superfamily)